MPSPNKYNQNPGVRTFDVTLNVTAFAGATIDDWCSELQDAVYAALEKKADEVRLPLTVVGSMCGHDPDTGYFVHVIASELVAGVRPGRTVNVSGLH